MRVETEAVTSRRYASLRLCQTRVAAWTYTPRSVVPGSRLLCAATPVEGRPRVGVAKEVGLEGTKSLARRTGLADPYAPLQAIATTEALLPADALARVATRTMGSGAYDKTGLWVGLACRSEDQYATETAHHNHVDQGAFPSSPAVAATYRHVDDERALAFRVA